MLPKAQEWEWIWSPDGPRSNHSPLMGPVLTWMGQRAGSSWLEECPGKACAWGGVERGEVPTEGFAQREGGVSP